jgi:signal transduction histidine kinase
MRRSLTARLLLGLILAQIAAVLVAMMIFPLMAPFITYDDIAENTLRRRIVASLVREEGGILALQPSRALASYAAARPGIAFAVLDATAKTLAAGGDPALGAALERLGPLYPLDDGSLKAAGPDGLGNVIIVTEMTSLGRVVIGSVGNRFRLEDVPSFFGAFLPAMFPIYGPIFIGAFVFMPWFVRRSLAPLRRAASAAQAIDAADPHARLPGEGVQTEFMPLIEAVNAALARLELGLKRQKLYAANAAHELRTPVAILKARISALAEGPIKAQLQGDAVRIATLVEQLLTAARLDSQPAMPGEEVDLVALLRDVVADRAPLALRSGRDIAVITQRRSMTLRGHARAIESAIANLLDNALRAEPRGGTVEARIDVDGTIAIIDHGPGVAETDRLAIFEPFWRKSDAEDGAGLGLAIVREVASRHGGSVTVADTPGGGATFRLTLAAGPSAAP